MTTALETITAAYREGNLLGINATPSAAEQAEGLTLLNTILAGVLGSGAGEELADLPIGGEWDQTWLCNEYVPDNARLVLNLSGAQTLELHPFPYEGQRLAVIDAGGNLAAYNLTLDGNGRLIEGSASLVLSTNSESRQWFYRADTASWQRLTGLASGDDLPFPSEFDDYFRIMLTMRLNPRHGQELQAGSSIWLDAMAAQLRARYRRPRPPQDYPTFGTRRGYGSSAAWNRGSVW